MPFQKYIRRRGKASESAITINPSNGYITLTVGATEEHELRKSKGAILYYDAESNRIGIERTNEDKAEGFLKFHKVGNFVKLIGKGFLEEFNILQDADAQQHKYPIVVDENNMLVIDLSQGVAVPASKRQRKAKAEAEAKSEQPATATAGVSDYVQSAVTA